MRGQESVENKVEDEGEDEPPLKRRNSSPHESEKGSPKHRRLDAPREESTRNSSEGPGNEGSKTEPEVTQLQPRSSKEIYEANGKPMQMLLSMVIGTNIDGSDFRLPPYSLLKRRVFEIKPRKKDLINEVFRRNQMLGRYGEPSTFWTINQLCTWLESSPVIKDPQEIEYFTAEVAKVQKFVEQRVDRPFRSGVAPKEASQNEQPSQYIVTSSAHQAVPAPAGVFQETQPPDEANAVQPHVQPSNQHSVRAGHGGHALQDQKGGGGGGGTAQGMLKLDNSSPNVARPFDSPAFMANLMKSHPDVAAKYSALNEMIESEHESLTSMTNDLLTCSGDYTRTLKAKMLMVLDSLYQHSKKVRSIEDQFQGLYGQT